MPFNDFENSPYAGKPIRLFDFWRQTKHWCYTTADRPIAWQGQTFMPAAIDMDSIKVNSEMQQMTRTITAPRDIAVADQYRISPPMDSVQLRVWMIHYGDTQAVTEWVGRVIQAKWQGSKVAISGNPFFASYRQTGLRLRWCRQCPYALYGPGCGVDQQAHRVNAILSGVNKFTLTADAFASLPDGRFAGGYLEWVDNDGLIDRRSIDAHTGTTITVAAGSPDFVNGLAISAYPGCNHTIADCQYFMNLPDYGGAPNIPTQNPVDGSIVF